jgi:hypothetical protein
MMAHAKAESIKQDAYLTIIKLARQHKEEGLFNQAEDFYRQAIAMARNLFSDGKDKQRLLLIETLIELASFYSFQGKDKFSQSLWLEILELGKNTLTAGDNIYVEAVFGLADVREKNGEILQAEALYKNLLQKQETIFGTDSLEICPAIKKAAAFYFRQQNYNRSEALYLKSLALEEFHLGTCSAQINSTVDALVNIFRKQKKWCLAEYMLGRQKDILNILHGEGSLCVASCELRLAELFGQSGQLEKAIRSYNNVLLAYAKIFGDRSNPILALKKKISALSAATISFAPEHIISAPVKGGEFIVPATAPVFMGV